MALGKIAVITGGSKGLGLAMAKYLAIQEGYTPVLIARSNPGLDDAASWFKTRGRDVYTLALDVSDHDAVEYAVSQIKERFGKIDFLVNNACSLCVEELRKTKTEEIKKNIDVGLFGSIICTRGFSELLNEGGRMLFISSGFGLVGVVGYSVYAAVKAGIINFADSVKRELSGKKIKVYVALPSDVDTPGFRDELKAMPGWMHVAGARGKAISADLAASRILSQCRGQRFFIFTDPMVYALYLMNKLFPVRIRNKVIDKLFPKP